MANGTLKVENIQTSSGSGTITLGQSGETVTIPTGTTVSGLMSNTPAFHVNTASTSLSNATHTTIPFTTEDRDTDNLYDTSTGKFTVTSSTTGYYFMGSI